MKFKKRYYALRIKEVSRDGDIFWDLEGLTGWWFFRQWEFIDREYNKEKILAVKKRIEITDGVTGPYTKIIE